MLGETHKWGGEVVQPSGLVFHPNEPGICSLDSLPEDPAATPFSSQFLFSPQILLLVLASALAWAYKVIVCVESWAKQISCLQFSLKCLLDFLLTHSLSFCLACCLAVSLQIFADPGYFFCPCQLPVLPWQVPFSSAWSGLPGECLASTRKLKSWYLKHYCKTQL